MHKQWGDKRHIEYAINQGQNLSNIRGKPKQDILLILTSIDEYQDHGLDPWLNDLSKTKSQASLIQLPYFSLSQ